MTTATTTNKLHLPATQNEMTYAVFDANPFDLFLYAVGKTEEQALTGYRKIAKWPSNHKCLLARYNTHDLYSMVLAHGGWSEKISSF